MSEPTWMDETTAGQPLKIRSWAATDVGRRRSTNEDRFFSDDDHGVFAVADGIGGKPGGQKASQTVVDELERRAAEIRRFVQTRSESRGDGGRQEIFDFLFDALQVINREVYRLGSPSKFPQGVGSTLDLVVTAPGGAFILHVGDSRVYLLRDDEIFRVTRDHTYEAYLRRQDSGGDESGDPGRYAHVLTRSIGGDPRVEVDRLFVDLSPGDRLLLCSDGVTRYLTGTEILETAQKTPDQQLANRLVDCANDRGGQDNATAVVVRADEPANRDFSATSTRPETFRYARFLEDVELFEKLEFQELMTILGYVRTGDYTAGELVVARGDAVDGMYFVMDGELTVEVDGRQVTTIGNGEHFGEFALFGESDRSADVRCQRDCQVLFISQHNLEQLVDQAPDLGTKLLWRLLSRTSEIAQQMLAERY